MYDTQGEILYRTYKRTENFEHSEMSNGKSLKISNTFLHSILISSSIVCPHKKRARTPSKGITDLDSQLLVNYSSRCVNGLFLFNINKKHEH